MLGGCIMLVTHDQLFRSARRWKSRGRCPVVDTSTTGRKLRGPIDEPGGTVRSEARPDLKSPMDRKASLGWLPDRSTHGVRGTHTARESEHENAPGWWTGAFSRTAVLSISCSCSLARCRNSATQRFLHLATCFTMRNDPGVPAPDEEVDRLWEEAIAQGVAGPNPVSPTNETPGQRPFPHRRTAVSDRFSGFDINFDITSDTTSGGHMAWPKLLHHDRS